MSYKRVPSSEAPRWAQSVARDAARDAARILGLGDIRVQWVKRRPGEMKAAWANEYMPGVIHIAVDWAEKNGADQVRALIFHEVRHLWQLANVRFYGYGEEGRREEDANQFAYQWTGQAPDILPSWEYRYVQK